jgi:hypothetical protein
MRAGISMRLEKHPPRQLRHEISSNNFWPRSNSACSMATKRTTAGSRRAQLRQDLRSQQSRHGLWFQRMPAPARLDLVPRCSRQSGTRLSATGQAPPLVAEDFRLNVDEPDELFAPCHGEPLSRTCEPPQTGSPLLDTDAPNHSASDTELDMRFRESEVMPETESVFIARIFNPRLSSQVQMRSNLTPGADYSAFRASAGTVRAAGCPVLRPWRSQTPRDAGSHSRKCPRSSGAS